MWFWLAAVAGCFVSLNATADEIDDRPEVVEIFYIGHAAFGITSPGGVKLLIDPYESRNWIGYDFPKEAFDPNVVLITHPHYDHDGGEYETGLSAYPPPVRTLRWPGEWELKDVTINGIKGGHAPPYGEDFGRANTVWRLMVNGVSIVHIGDNGLLDAESIEQIGSVDILFLPADGLEHILSHRDTTAILAALDPAVIIPMHYRIDELEEANALDDLGNIADWLAKRPESFTMLGHTLRISRADLPEQQTIWVMQPMVSEINRQTN